MRKNRTGELWRDDGCALNVWLHNPGTVQTELLANLGFDSVTVDMQHGSIDYRDAVNLLTAISTTTATPIARVPINEISVINRLLDAGAFGIMCPVVNTKAEAESFVEACLYPPDGIRSFGPLRALAYGGPDYFDNANETVLTIAQVETGTSLENLDEILSVQGLDAVYVGSADLSLSLGGRPVIDHTDPAAAKVHAEIVDAAHRHGVKVGLHSADPEGARICVEHGADLVTLGTDHGMITKTAKSLLEATRESVATVEVSR